MSKKIFLAFIGEEIKQKEPIFEIEDGYECWDLKAFKLDEFIEVLKGKIAPINQNVLRNYKAGAGTPDMFGITEKQFNECSWGLLIPESLDDSLVSSYAETIFLVNLYSPTFLYPHFYASDFGIMRQDSGKGIFTYAHYQNQSALFSKKEFVAFFELLLPQSQYGTWQLDRIQKWNEEDWRLFVAGWLYGGLKEYDNSKNSFGWQRESADMGAILESLFTAGDTQNEEIGYRLRKRIAVLLSSRYPSIEKEIKELYMQRSSFVHGSFFAQIAKDSKQAYNNLPTPDFGLLYRQKEYVRLALVAYFYLARSIKIDVEKNGTSTTVIRVLEDAIIDMKLREKVLAEVEKILSLTPTTKF